MKKESKVLLGLLLFLILVYLIFGYLPEKELDNGHRYTIAEIIKFESQSEGSKEAKIIYNY